MRKSKLSKYEVGVITACIGGSKYGVGHLLYFKKICQPSHFKKQSWVDFWGLEVVEVLTFFVHDSWERENSPESLTKRTGFLILKL